MASMQDIPTAKGGFRCPICGALESDGGCREIKKCIAGLVAAEAVCTRETVAALTRKSPTQQIRILTAGLNALSQLHIGLILCRANGKVIASNRVADDILAARDGLELSPEGILCAIEGGDPPIAELVRQAAKPGRSGRFAKDTAVPALRQAQGKRPLSIFVRASQNLPQQPAMSKEGVLIIILDSALPVAFIEPELRQLYNLTSSEARLANLLMEGKALEDCCNEMAICRSTGRTHLRRLFRKAGVHRQSELVALLLKSIGLACLADPGTTTGKDSSGVDSGGRSRREANGSLSAL